MARNPFRNPGLPQVKDDQWLGNSQNLNSSVPDSLPSMSESLESSPRALASPTPASIPSITRPEHSINPELKRERFKKLAGLLGGFKKPSI